MAQDKALSDAERANEVNVHNTILDTAMMDENKIRMVEHGSAGKEEETDTV